MLCTHDDPQSDAQAGSVRRDRAGAVRAGGGALEVLPAIPIGTLSPASAASFALVGPRVRGFADRVTARVLPTPGALFLRVYLVEAN